MWIVIYLAQNRKMADKIEMILNEEGMLVRVKQISKNLENDEGIFEVLVPKGEGDEAREILYEAGY